jgi:hypothetical protein
MGTVKKFMRGRRTEVLLGLMVALLAAVIFWKPVILTDFLQLTVGLLVLTLLVLIGARVRGGAILHRKQVRRIRRLECRTTPPPEIVELLPSLREVKISRPGECLDGIGVLQVIATGHGTTWAQFINRTRAGDVPNAPPVEGVGSRRFPYQDTNAWHRIIAALRKAGAIGTEKVPLATMPGCVQESYYATERGLLLWHWNRT